MNYKYVFLDCCNENIEAIGFEDIDDAKESLANSFIRVVNHNNLNLANQNDCFLSKHKDYAYAYVECGSFTLHYEWRVLPL